MNMGRSELKAFLFFWTSHIHWPISNFFWNTEQPQWKHLSGPPPCKIETNLHPWIIVYIQRSWTLGKPNGIKPRCYWEHLGECILELVNLLGTYWEQGEKTKNSLPPTLRQKEKNRAHRYCTLSLPIGCMNFLFPNLFVTIFSVGEYPHYKLGVLINLKNHLDHFSQRFFEVKICFISRAHHVLQIGRLHPMVKKEVVSQRNALVKASHQCTILMTMMGFAIMVMEVK